MVDLDQCREITAESIAEKARNAQDHSGRHLDELQGTCECPWANERRQDETKLRSETDPDPLAPVCAQVAALTVRAGLLGMFAPDAVPHLIELHLSDGQVPPQVGIDLMRLLGRSPQPLQDGGFRHPQDKANVRQGHFDQKHFQRHDHLLFGGPQVKENCIARFREGLLTGTTPEDTSLPALGHIGRTCANVATVDQPIMRTIRVGTRLAPVLRFSHGPNLRSSGGVLHTARKFGLFSFSKYYRVSTAAMNCSKIVVLPYMHAFVNHTQKEYARGDVHENRAECLFSLLKPYVRVFRGISKTNLPGYVGSFQFLRNFHQLTAFEQAEMILYAALDPAVAGKARKGDFVRCLDHFKLLQSPTN